jgi:hypothetical protein
MKTSRDTLIQDRAWGAIGTLCVNSFALPSSVVCRRKGLWWDMVVIRYHVVYIVLGLDLTILGEIDCVASPKRRVDSLIK